MRGIYVSQTTATHENLYATPASSPPHDSLPIASVLSYLAPAADGRVQVRRQLRKHPPPLILTAVIAQPLRELREPQATPTHGPHADVEGRLGRKEFPVLNVAPLFVAFTA